jgi:hypothetical protein
MRAPAFSVTVVVDADAVSKTRRSSNSAATDLCWLVRDRRPEEIRFEGRTRESIARIIDGQLVNRVSQEYRSSTICRMSRSGSEQRISRTDVVSFWKDFDAESKKKRPRFSDYFVKEFPTIDLSLTLPITLTGGLDFPDVASRNHIVSTR